jgi:hypothetical protein
MMRHRAAACAVGLMLCAACQPAVAATLRVGPAQALHLPSDAAAIAHDGDTVTIEAGEYFDCAIWTADNLTIAGDGQGVVLTDRACEGKASFVTRGRGITVRDITFTRIRVFDRNGAGIRAEGRDLTVERARFVNNEIGILAADADGSSLAIRDCDFTDNGRADILAGNIALLRVERSRMSGGKAGPAITSAAARSELVGNRIEVRLNPQSEIPYLVGITNGGSLAMQDNEIALTAGVPRLGAVLVAPPGIWPTAAAVSIRGTVFANHTGLPAVLLRDWGGGTPLLADNTVQPGDIALSTDGAILNRAKQAAHIAIAWLRWIAGRAHAAVALVFRHL